MRHLDATPWARRALDPTDMVRLEARAREMGVKVRVGGKSPGGAWLAKITGQGVAVELRGIGALSAVIDAALDDWQATA